MLAYTQKKLKNKAINYVDSYVPLGYTLGDFTSTLKIDNDDNDDNDDYNMNNDYSEDEQQDEEDEDKNKELYNLITNKLINRRRIDSFSDNGDENYYNNNDNDNDNCNNNDNTIVEFIIPSSLKIERIINIDLFINGLSLLNMSLNNKVILNNEKNLNNLLPQSISKILNSIKIDNNNNNKIISDIFNSLDDKLKLEILKNYLQDTKLVNEIRDKDYEINQPSYSVHELIIILIQTGYTITWILYQQIGIPLIRYLTKVLFQLNTKYHIIESILQLLIQFLNMVINFLLLNANNFNKANKANRAQMRKGKPQRAV